MKHILPLITLTILTGCANPIVPTGGPKDVAPPKLISLNIPSHSTNIKPIKIEFAFDENIQTNNLNEEVVISPILAIPPKIISHKKSLSILFDTSALENNTTYTVTLNKAVSDLNEGNNTTYNSYLFSTGNTIDTHRINSRYISFTGISFKKIKAFLTDSNKSKPLYKANILNQNISIEGLSLGTKKMFLFDDLNNNDTADQDEARGFTYTKARDSSVISIYTTQLTPVRVWQLSKDRFKIYGYSTSFLQQNIKLKYGDGIYILNDTLYCSDSIYDQIKQLPASSLYQIPNKPEKGTIYKKTVFQLSQFSPDSFLRIYYQSDSAIPVLKFTSPDKHANFRYTISETNRNRYDIILSSQPEFTIKTNMTDSFTVKQAKIQQTTFFNTNNFPAQIIIKHTASSQKYTDNIKANSELNIGLLPGEYDIIYWHDANNDQHITPPASDFSVNGEKTRLIKNLKIKENIDFHMKLNFNSDGE